MTAPRKLNNRWTSYDPPWVEEDGNAPFRYRVESQSEPGRIHLVDLTGRHGFGACDCDHFHFTANPTYKEKGLYIPYEAGRAGVTECKHIRAAFDHYHLTVTVKMLARFAQGIP